MRRSVKVLFYVESLDMCILYTMHYTCTGQAGVSLYQLYSILHSYPCVPDNCKKNGYVNFILKRMYKKMRTCKSFLFCRLAMPDKDKSTFSP